MTERMLGAISNPNMDILGHCTDASSPAAVDRNPTSITKPYSPHAETMTSPLRSTRARSERTLPATSYGSRSRSMPLLIDTDGHAPEQLAWQYIGCDRAAECGVTEDRVITK